MPTSPTRRRGGPRGFTLIELMVVLVVLALAATLVAPPLGAALGLGQMNREVGAVVTALREARSQAMIAGKATDFRVDGARRWQVGERDRTLPDRLSLRLVVPPAGQGPDGQSFVRFFADGHSTGGRVEILAGENREAVLVDWLTGHVHEE